jgi:hypothetical protein
MGLPVVKYTPQGGSEVTLQFVRGPVDFQCSYAGRVQNNVATSGLKERVAEHLDMFITFRMPAMLIGGDLDAWTAFTKFALPGETFAFAPNSDVNYWFRCVTEDEDWQPARSGYRRYAANFKWRIVPDEQVPDSPGTVMKRFWGILS